VASHSIHTPRNAQRSVVYHSALLKEPDSSRKSDSLHNVRSLLTCFRSHLLSIHELGQLLDEEMTDAETDDLKEAETVCRRFMAWNLEGTEGYTKGKLTDVLSSVENGEQS
jgi:hypothetical protein